MNRQYALWYVLLALIALVAALIPIMLSSVTLTAGPIVFALIAAVVLPPVLIWLFQKMGYPLGRPIACPRCGTEMPPFRKPASVRQAMWGGYTCPSCGTEMDARGRPLA